MLVYQAGYITTQRISAVSQASHLWASPRHCSPALFHSFLRGMGPWIQVSLGSKNRCISFTVHMYVFMYVYIYTYLMYICICMYVYIYIHWKKKTRWLEDHREAIYHPFVPWSLVHDNMIRISIIMGQLFIIPFVSWVHSFCSAAACMMDASALTWQGF